MQMIDVFSDLDELAVNVIRERPKLSIDEKATMTKMFLDEEGVKDATINIHRDSEETTQVNVNIPQRMGCLIFDFKIGEGEDF